MFDWICCYNLRLICASMRATRLLRISLGTSYRQLYAATTSDYHCPQLMPLLISLYLHIQHLVEWVGSCAPVGEEQAQADSLEDARDNSNGNSVQRSLLSDDLCDDLDTKVSFSFFHC